VLRTLGDTGDVLELSSDDSMLGAESPPFPDLPDPVDYDPVDFDSDNDSGASSAADGAADG